MKGSLHLGRSARRVAACACASFVFASLFVAVPRSAADPGEEDPRTSAAGSDYAVGKKAVEAKNWKSAIERLNKALLQDDRNPDIHNLLGYAYRNAGQLDSAFKHYHRALELNPRHRGAREYLGEAYLLANDVQKAQEQLAALGQICLIPCEEYGDLEKAILAYSKRAARSR
jgi:Flp pilus assembly protein TadD